jgi:hypothetical protein
MLKVDYLERKNKQNTVHANPKNIEGTIGGIYSLKCIHQKIRKSELIDLKLLDPIPHPKKKPEVHTQWLGVYVWGRKREREREIDFSVSMRFIFRT